MQKLARITGLLYLLLIPLGIFGIIYVPTTLIIPDNIATTINNLVANEMLFRLSIISALIVQLVNIIVVIFLYKLLKSVNQTQAILMVIFLLLGIPIAFVNELNQFAILIAIHSLEKFQLLIPLFLELHQSGILIAQIFWGLWLLPMGYLVYKSGFLPKIIGLLLLIGGFGYLFDSFTYFLFPYLNLKVSQYTFIGEFCLALWLSIKGINFKKQSKI